MRDPLRRVRGLVCVVVCAAVLGLAACGEERGLWLDRKLVVATDTTLPPMSFINDQNEIDGFEKDLIDALAREAGFDYELVNIEWNGLFGGLITNKYDLVISSVTILDERRQRMAFSIPYLKSGLSLVVRRDEERIQSLEDVEEQGGMVGAQRATTAYFYLEDYPDLNKQAYELYGHAIQDLIKGEIDAVLGESTGTLYYKNKDAAVFEKIRMVGDIMTEEFYGIVTRKDETKLLRTVNRALETLIENGTVKHLHTKWDLGQAAVVPEKIYNVSP